MKVKGFIWVALFLSIPSFTGKAAVQAGFLKVYVQVPQLGIRLLSKLFQLEINALKEAIRTTGDALNKTGQYFQGMKDGKMLANNQSNDQNGHQKPSPGEIGRILTTSFTELFGIVWKVVSGYFSLAMQFYRDLFVLLGQDAVESIPGRILGNIIGRLSGHNSEIPSTTAAS